MSNEIKTRPLTPTEQKYTYAQSMQLEGQTGTIGHLRGDFATTGYSLLFNILFSTDFFLCIRSVTIRVHTPP